MQLPEFYKNNKNLHQNVKVKAWNIRILNIALLNIYLVINNNNDTNSYTDKVENNKEVKTINLVTTKV